MTRRPFLVVACLAAFAGVAIAALPVAAQSDGAQSDGAQSDGTASSTSTAPVGDPGVYVQELPADQIEAAPSGVTLFVGTGSADVDGAPVSTVSIGSSAEFAESVQGASPALTVAVEQFFAQGGTTAIVQLVTDESAPSLVAAVAGSVAEVRGWDLLVVPAMNGLDGESWVSLANEMGQAAERATGIALLDPPSSVAQPSDPEWASALVAVVEPVRQSPAAGSMAMLSSSLVLLDGQTVSSAAVLAGLFAATDRSSGPWAPAGGPSQPMRGLTAAVPANNSQATVLAAGGINSIMALPTIGTIVMGDRTLSTDVSTQDLSRQRMLDFLRRSIATGLQPYVFEPDGPATWASVVEQIEGFLTTQWTDGGLFGATASRAFDVVASEGASMTAEQIDQGLMVVDVEVSLEDGEASLQFTQQVQPPN